MELTQFFLSHQQIHQIPKTKTVTYARICANFRQQKYGPYRIQLTVGRNLLFVPGDLSTKTDDLPTATLLWNSLLLNPDAKFSTIDIKNMYLQTLMFS